MWEHGDILNDRSTSVKLYASSLGSLMAGGSHLSSDDCGFHPRLGLKNHFSEDRARRTFIYYFMSSV